MCVSSQLIVQSKRGCNGFNFVAFVSRFTNGLKFCCTCKHLLVYCLMGAQNELSCILRRIYFDFAMEDPG